MTGMEFASVSKNVTSTEGHEEGDLLSQRSRINVLGEDEPDCDANESTLFFENYFESRPIKRQEFFLEFSGSRNVVFYVGKPLL